jgi:hypothetical protein
MAATGANVAARGADRLSRPRAIHRTDHSSSIVGLRDYLTMLPASPQHLARPARPTRSADMPVQRRLVQMKPRRRNQTLERKQRRESDQTVPTLASWASGFAGQRGTWRRQPKGVRRRGPDAAALGARARGRGMHSPTELAILRQFGAVEANVPHAGRERGEPPRRSAAAEAAALRLEEREAEQR